MFPGTLLFTCTTSCGEILMSAVQIREAGCVYNRMYIQWRKSMKRENFRKRYEGWSSYRSWIFCGILYLWHDGCCRRFEYLAGSPNLPDQPDIGRSVCGTGHYFCRRLHVEMAMTQLIINLRYCLMSFSLSQKFRR